MESKVGSANVQVQGHRERDDEATYAGTTFSGKFM